MDRFTRTKMLLGSVAMKKLENANILLVGIGGVGSYAAETLVRTGVGNITLMDHDFITHSNINRQLHALENTVGQPKVMAMRNRLLSINPRANILADQRFYTAEIGEKIISENYHFVIDAVDDVAAKIDIIYRCKANTIPIISSMGAGNKINPMSLTIADISKTNTCRLARVIRKELRKRNICRDVPVVFSPEAPAGYIEEGLEQSFSNKGCLVGSVVFVPAVAGIYLAHYVITKLLTQE